ncbi:uncharacterized protein RHOBADRAFT_43913 [Rhodotorula graminis WP1]|uniref:Uncharacterized protein n=1 Tax=Rhodotorula graminis (strain WP1) TaxID=578459 RepID=A0A194S494_RHOGW|nr:uncharacterized protein RHOBADRAFT_43913 [Rhodotorula graminis WP1]KPV75407.1 hypothetical protein RHOBADRAFT_43913 [Rhodotorula graminis WP1]
MLRSTATAASRRTAFARTRPLSTVRVVPPSPAAPRHLALPLAFVSVSGWDKLHLDAWRPWIDRFAERGYSSILLDIDPAVVDTEPTSASRLDRLEQELVSLLRDPAASSPFPPLLFASGPSALVAETYVSSHPLSGLCLVSPLSAASAHPHLPRAFPTTLDDFNYEPGFPIAVVAPQGSAAGDHRLVDEFGPQEGEDEDDAIVRRIVGERDTQGWETVMEWMDSNGL